MPAAKPTDWETHPLPERRATIPLDRAFSPAEMRRIRRGMVPDVMEDKWFIYWRDGTLHFHRSWTGFCIYAVRFEADGAAGRMVEALANRDPDQYNGTDDARDAAVVGYLVDVLLLRRPAEFPVDPKVGGPPAMQEWALVGQWLQGIYPDGA